MKVIEQLDYRKQIEFFVPHKLGVGPSQNFQLPAKLFVSFLQAFLCCSNELTSRAKTETKPSHDFSLEMSQRLSSQAEPGQNVPPLI